MCGIALFIYQEDKEDFVDEIMIECEKELRKRGPDSFSKLNFTFSSYKVALLASVLSMRGEIPTKQPIQVEKNLLLFNGEVYGSDHFDIKENENDGMLLAQSLSKCEEENSIKEVLQSLKGEFALIFWHKKLETFFIAKSESGQRSLLFFQQQQQQQKQHSLAAQLKEELFFVSSVSFLGREKHEEEFPLVEMQPQKLYTLKIKAGVEMESLEWREKKGGGGKEIEEGKIKEMEENVLKFRELFLNSIKRRTSVLPPLLKEEWREEERKGEVGSGVKLELGESRVAVLFSGGIDSLSVAVFLHFCIPKEEPIE